MVNCVKGSSRMRSEDLEAFIARLRASITASRAVSVECPLLNQTGGCQEVVLCKKDRDLVENNSFKCFHDEWKKGYWSVIFLMG